MSPRALLSVYDKTGVVAFAKGLVDLGWELVSSGGTGRALAEAGVPHLTVEEVTGSPEMLGHRVVTLHPKLHGALLADTDNESHVADLEEHGITPIQLVAVNLYPFRTDPGIELIDVGGPTMVRAAAKNHKHVGIVIDPSDYGAVLDELRLEGSLATATKTRLARKAFAHTAAYDAAIVTWFDADDGPQAAAGIELPALPPTIHLALEEAGGELRYGENPHQQGRRYARTGEPGWWDGVTQHGGMALSYLNIFDADAAWAMVQDLKEIAGAGGAAATIIKHANPCGAAIAGSLSEAYEKAFECDPMSAFGGIIALSGEVDEALAAEMVANPKADVLIAPGYSAGALEVFAAKRKNMRVLEAPAPTKDGLHLRQINGGFLVQQPYSFPHPRSEWQVVTKVAPTEEQWRDLELAWRLCAYVKSNAIVYVNDGVAVGIGAGQQNRVEPGEIAARKAAGRAKGGACASDAFFPFRDGLDAAAAAGVAAVAEPGGSLRDDEVIAAADEHGIAMVFTGERQFQH